MMQARWFGQKLKNGRNNINPSIEAVSKVNKKIISTEMEKFKWMSFKNKDFSSPFKMVES